MTPTALSNTVSLLLLVIIATILPEEVLAFAPGTAAVRLHTTRTFASRHATPSEEESSSSSSPLSIIENNRKTFLQSFFTVAASTAISTISLQLTVASATAASNKGIGGAASFLGTYSDPINHPGGTRTITLVDGASSGDYQLAQVKGGGGRGEPQEYVLPAVIFGDRAIVIDFSPKGGPRDFAGTLESDGSIRSVRDGNRWPRL
jgi:hypothetical protein